MSFTAKDVAKLREMTQAGMMDCKKALVETDGNMDEAVAFLRKKGLSSAAKKAGKVAADGVIGVEIAADAKSAVLVEVNSQTDFVARNDNFKAFVAQVTKAALENKTKTLDELLNTTVDGTTISEHAVQQTATIGEKIDVRRVEFFDVADGAIGAYVHPVGFKVGALVKVAGGQADAANDVAMHIAAANPAPEFTTKDEISNDQIEAEKKIEMGKEDLAGKPPEIAEKIVTGRVNKIFAAKVLSEQPFIKNPDQTVAQFLGDAKVEKFVLFNLGEGIEKKEDNLADEVAAIMNG